MLFFSIRMEKTAKVNWEDLNNEDVNKISENVAGQLAEAVILHYEK